MRSVQAYPASAPCFPILEPAIGRVSTPSATSPTRYPCIAPSTRMAGTRVAERNICFEAMTSRQQSLCSAAASGAARDKGRPAASSGRLAATRSARSQSAAGGTCSLQPCGTFRCGRLTVPCARCCCRETFSLPKPMRSECCRWFSKDPLGSKRNQGNRREFGALLLRWAEAQIVMLANCLTEDIQSGFAQGDDAPEDSSGSGDPAVPNR
jgi:hypothetical protein